jgi:hypothetical protein
MLATCFMAGERPLVLRSIPHKDVIKKVAELKENQEEYDPKDPELIKFQNDLVDILTPDNVSAIN